MTKGGPPYQNNFAFSRGLKVASCSALDAERHWEYRRRSDRAQELCECCTGEEVADPMNLEAEEIRKELVAWE